LIVIAANGPAPAAATQWATIREPDMTNPVTEVAAASPDQALAHFQAQFAFETDCWDVHEALRQQDPGFVLLDVRGPEAYAAGHVPGAVNLPHRKLIQSRIQPWPGSTLFVVYCAGPHCNGAARAALRLAALGRPVKLMAGGLCGWLDEGFAVAQGTA
jgi:rhodanese-related sulfurtransferase